eukprot:TRINITY_DN84407_c0_g1_i1.p2 TRINITY_DN84407_c0_g1~~TRINITY_DN84407_c0_g1_i1.p2  ORF type:complete len:194 (+),score=37.76 TRINITY_DN84407_c0_g1_i1:104-685(+)
MSVKTYSFDPKAYAKAVMHCSKHASESVLGVLLGSASGSTLTVSDVVPLFHTHSLAPMLKIAFMIIDQHCQSTSDEIVGIYYATPSGNTELTPVKAIADKVASNYAGGASAWGLDAAKVGQDQFAFVGMRHAKDQWSACGADAGAVSQEGLKHTKRLISEMKYLDVVDFDDHLNNPSLNWLNPDLFKGDAIAK